MTEVKIIGTKELAKRHSIDPKLLRTILRSQPGAKPDHKRYEWAENDPFLKKVPAMIVQYKEGHSGKKGKPVKKKEDEAKPEAKKSTPAKKSAPKKKAAKKASAKRPSAVPPATEEEPLIDDVEDTQDEPEFEEGDDLEEL